MGATAPLRHKTGPFACLGASAWTQPRGRLWPICLFYGLGEKSTSWPQMGWKRGVLEQNL